MDDLVIAKKYLSKFNNAVKAGHEFTLTFNQYKKLRTRKTCGYSGLPFNEVANRWDSLTLDRIDNNLGYTAENTIACCYGINQLKSQIENRSVPLTSKVLVKTALKIQKITKGVTYE